MTKISVPALPAETAGATDGSPHLSSTSALFWLKTTDPDMEVPVLGEGTDARAIVPEGERFRPLREQLKSQGVAVRTVKYWLEREAIRGTVTQRGGWDLVSHSTTSLFGEDGSRVSVRHDGVAAAVARDVFASLWETAAPEAHEFSDSAPAEDIVPSTWLPYLPHETLNPAQVQAAPSLLTGNENVLVVAPTGAGKTTIGMLAALRAVLGEGRKAAWLVPQRSLTEELDRELEAWRERGLRVERLSGERSIDVERVRDADLWVTTTEKFEVLSRTSSMREALGKVGCLIVDEVHLLGDPERGPVLEALLARVREEGSDVRIVGLSATVSNADQMSDWLRARLVRIAWRPSRLTWQLPSVPASADRHVTQAARTRVTNAIVSMVTADGGSVLVFCGSKHSVRSTALALAASRGVNTNGVRPDDAGRLRQVSQAAGIGLHYKDWEYKREAEQAFRSREIDVLVATSTVAAGVNLPARAVVVRDTQIGLRGVDVATVQQMFGRAGRVGAGEREGWAFMIVDASERAYWQEQLNGGYTVNSQISTTLPDHVLAEAVQLRIRTLADVERWWLGTLAYHQGNRSMEPLRRAVDFLVGADYLSLTEDAEGRTVIRPTELGVLTTRVMVPTDTGYQLRMGVAQAALPTDASEAESRLIELVSTLVPKLAKAPLAENLKPAVESLLRADGHLSRVGDDTGIGDDTGRAATDYAPGHLARASLLAVANSPHDFARPRRQFASIPHSAMYPVLEDAPRFLHWLGSQGPLGTIHPWVAVVAADLSRRIRWRRCAPPRGSGRLLWMCEQMATPLHAAQVVPQMWIAARERGLADPEWLTRTPPRGCRLEAISYAGLLRERVLAAELLPRPDGSVTCRAAGRVLATWRGTTHRSTVTQQAEVDGVFPAAGNNFRGAGEQGAGETGAVVFSRRGDYRATGWLGTYSGVQPGGR
ncbi:DEAD/DEAH box helicase [Streptomyces sp. GMY02]|uniref:DEAD/DEAH box helicase n=1 Tax=Streptomyces sp. GMY02 TaxID=1333528 RepID=UPI001C2BFC03|nr:DEAD/DEAH box helicase [Streptomyces sp. GMY02]QXE33227.1 DEAD/DEAH box helicase [Streptomyces sp. GMY02]